MSGALARPHLAIVGPTATGKSALALRVAEAVGDVEIVSLDAMAVYRGMDVGTATPTLEERARVPHHLVDVADPGEEWSVARTRQAAAEARAEIEARGHRAIFVGGTGLYVRAVVDDLDLPGEDPAVRADLVARTATPVGLDEAYRRLQRLDPWAAGRIAPTNRRRVVRALEVIEVTGRPFSSFGPGLDVFGPPAFPVVLVGVWLPRRVVAARIEGRVARMLEEGLVEEVRRLGERPLSRTAAQAIGYREVVEWLRGERPSWASMRDEICRRTRALARRQRMWFRRDPRVRWLGTPRDPSGLVDAVVRAWDRLPVGVT